jgi:hypothetical protein
MVHELALSTRPQVGIVARFALTLAVVAVAGVAALGSVAVAPAASAATSGDTGVVLHSGNGPNAFVELEHGRMPVFECDALNENKRQRICIDVDGPTRF